MTLSIRNLHFGYATHSVFEGLNLEIEQGSIHGLLGLNGMGKSTLIKLIMGLKEPSMGEIQLFGQELTKFNRDHLIQDIGVLIEQAPLYSHLTAYEHLKIIKITRNLAEQAILDGLESVNLTKHAHQKIKTFSMGMKQRLGLALATLADPRFIILDEPTNGLDPIGVAEFRETVLSLNKVKGITFLIATHIIEEIEQLATDFCIVHNKGILATGKINQQEPNDFNGYDSLRALFVHTAQSQLTI
jgi:ABC-2 type transport system ATP-binding protein